MTVFTYWDGNPKYAACIEHNKIIYPELQIIFRERIYDKYTTDRPRIETLIDISGDALYMDGDCWAIKKFNGCDKPAFPNHICGRLDYWAIYKPAGSEYFFKRLLAECDWNKNGDICRLINGVYRTEIEIIYGYPTYQFMRHKNFQAQETAESKS